MQLLRDTFPDTCTTDTAAAAAAAARKCREDRDGVYGGRCRVSSRMYFCGDTYLLPVDWRRLRQSGH